LGGLFGLRCSGFGLLALGVQSLSFRIQLVQQLFIVLGQIVQHLPKGQQFVQIIRLHQQADFPAFVQQLHGGQLLLATVISGAERSLLFFQRLGRSGCLVLGFGQLGAALLQLGHNAAQLAAQCVGLALQVVDLLAGVTGLLLHAVQCAGGAFIFALRRAHLAL